MFFVPPAQHFPIPLALLTSVALFLAGCQPTQAPQKLEHVTIPHQPETLLQVVPAIVYRLRRIEQLLGRELPADAAQSWANLPESLHDTTATVPQLVQQIDDQFRWMTDLAADTELRQADWESLCRERNTLQSLWRKLADEALRDAAAGSQTSSTSTPVSSATSEATEQPAGRFDDLVQLLEDLGAQTIQQARAQATVGGSSRAFLPLEGEPQPTEESVPAADVPVTPAK